MPSGAPILYQRPKIVLPQQYLDAAQHAILEEWSPSVLRLVSRGQSYSKGHAKS